MNEALQIITGGLLQGSVFAIVALGYALIYRVTGAINLTQGAFCILAALIAYSLERTFEWPVPLAVATAIVVTTVYGLIMGAAIFVPALMRLPASGLLMVTAGLLTFTNGLALVIWGGDPYSLPPFSGEHPIEVLGTRISTQGLWVAGAAAIVMVGFWYLFTRTRLGIALQACAENPTAARLMGVDLHRMAVLTFTLSALVAALGGVVVAPILSIQFDTGQVFSILGFIAVAIGGMGSFVGAAVGGLALGIAKQLAAGYVSSLFSEALALCLLLVMLLWRPQGLFALGRPRRSDVRDEQHVHAPILRLHGRGALLFGVVLGAVLFALPSIISDTSLINSLAIAGILFISVLGLDILMGFAGEISLGQAAFMAIGGYTAAVLTTTYYWPPLLSTLAGMLLSLVCALLLALATVRLRGVYLALATLAFGLVVDSLAIGLRGITGGPSGLTGIPSFSVGGFVFDTDRSMYYLVAAIVLVLLVTLTGATHATFGRALMAVRADRMAAGALGINVTRVKMIAFAIGSVLASLSGSLYAFHFQFLSPEMVGTVRSFELLTMLVVGGAGTLVGPLFGVVLLTLLPVIFQPLALYKTIGEGALLVLAFRYLPGGLLGGLVVLWWRLGGLIRERPAVPHSASRHVR